MTASASSAAPTGLAADPQATATVSIMGSNGVKVSITNEGGDPLSVRDVLSVAARVLDLPAFDVNTVGAVQNGAPANLDDPVQPDALVGAAANVGNG